MASCEAMWQRLHVEVQGGSNMHQHACSHYNILCIRAQNRIWKQKKKMLQMKKLFELQACNHGVGKQNYEHNEWTMLHCLETQILEREIPSESH